MTLLRRVIKLKNGLIIFTNDIKSIYCGILLFILNRIRLYDDKAINEMLTVLKQQ